MLRFDTMINHPNQFYVICDKSNTYYINNDEVEKFKNRMRELFDPYSYKIEYTFVTAFQKRYSIMITFYDDLARAQFLLWTAGGLEI